MLVNATTSGGSPPAWKPLVLCVSTTALPEKHQSPHLRRIEGRGQLLPVDQVGADGVAPVHVAPVPAVGVVLVEEVIFARLPDQAVGVVEPAAPRREVELRPVRLAVDPAGVGDVVGLGDPASPREPGSAASSSIRSVLPRYASRSAKTRNSGLPSASSMSNSRTCGPRPRASSAASPHRSGPGDGGSDARA